MKKLAIIIAATTLMTFGFARVATAQPTISKELTFVTGPANTDPVPQGAGQPTTYEFTINYDSQGSPAVTILDKIPNEFNTVTAQGGNCNPLTVQQGGNRDEARIRCELPANTDADILVTFQTRNNLSHAKRQFNLYEPSECTLDGFLLLNDGAVALGPKSDPIAGPTPPLSVAIFDCPQPSNAAGAEQEQRQADGDVLPKSFPSNS